MKKAILYLLCLVICLSFLSGCGEPQIYYCSYADGLFAGIDVLNQLPNYYPKFNAYQFWHQPVGDHENPNVQQELTVNIGDLQLTGEYRGYRLPGWKLSYYTDEYIHYGQYYFRVNRNTGQVVYLHMGDSEELRAQPDLENPREETEQIAKKWAGYYVEDLSEYTLKFHQKEDCGYYDIYHYSFRRYINDVPTTDYIEIDITSKGTLDEIKCEEIDAFKNVTFDMSVVEENIEKYVQKAWSQYEFSVVSYEMSSGYPFVCLTIDKQVAVVAELRFQLKDPIGVECTAGMDIVTLVSTDPDEVIPPRPNPFL